MDCCSQVLVAECWNFLHGIAVLVFFLYTPVFKRVVLLYGAVRPSRCQHVKNIEGIVDFFFKFCM